MEDNIHRSPPAGWCVPPGSLQVSKLFPGFEDCGCGFAHPDAPLDISGGRTGRWSEWEVPSPIRHPALDEFPFFPTPGAPAFHPSRRWKAPKNQIQPVLPLTAFREWKEFPACFFHITPGDMASCIRPPNPRYGEKCHPLHDNGLPPPKHINAVPGRASLPIPSGAAAICAVAASGQFMQDHAPSSPWIIAR